MVIAGAVLSEKVLVTTRSNDVVPTYPAASDAVHVTVVVPTLNIEPDARSQVGPLVIPTLSVAVGSVYDTATPAGFVVAAATFSGWINPGGVVSTNVYSTVTSNVDDPSFPAASDAQHVTVVVPIGNVEPDDFVHVGPLTTSLSSVAETENVTAVVPFGSSVETVMSFGTLTVGEVVSAATTNILPCMLLFSLS